MLHPMGEIALGVATAGHWAIDLPNEANRKFVADFRAAYKRDPAFYAAQAYDAANFINSAVVAVKGDSGQIRTRSAPRWRRPIMRRSAGRI